MQQNDLRRWWIGSGSALGLLLVFVFQSADPAALAGLPPGTVQNFIVNRSARFLLNDLFTIGLIYALFAERKYVIFAVWIELTGLVFFLLPYFLLKIQFPTYNGPLLSFLHRLVLNPTLLMLLIPAFYLQKKSKHH